MSDGTSSDPIFPEQPIAPPEGHEPTPRHAAATDWVVVHRGGAGSKAHVEALERTLIKARISARIEHDDEGRVVLEVPRDSEREAIDALGDGNTHRAGEKAHESAEERIENSEHLHGAFATVRWQWLAWVLVVVVLALFAGYYFVGFFGR